MGITTRDPSDFVGGWVPAHSSPLLSSVPRAAFIEAASKSNANPQAASKSEHQAFFLSAGIRHEGRLGPDARGHVAELRFGPARVLVLRQSRLNEAKTAELAC